MLSLPARTQDPHTGKAQTQPPPQQPFHFKQFLELARLVPVLRPVPSLFPQPGMLFLYMDLHAIGSFLSFRCQLKCHLLRKAFLVHPTKNNLPVSLYCITVLIFFPAVIKLVISCLVTIVSFISCIIRAIDYGTLTYHGPSKVPRVI